MFGIASFAEVPYASLSGGVVYAVSIEEDATGTVTSSSLAQLLSSASETATGTIAFSSLGQLLSSTSETATGTEALASSIAFYSALAETGTATETLSPSIEVVSTLEETSTVTEEPLTNVILSALVEEPPDPDLYLQPTSTLPTGTSFTGSVIFDNTSAGARIAVISNGSGTGGGGGFDAGGNYILINFPLNTQAVYPPLYLTTKTLDLTDCYSVEITVIRGNNSNGGRPPTSGEDLFIQVWNGNTNNWSTIGFVGYNSNTTSFTTLTYYIPTYARIANGSLRLRKLAEPFSNVHYGNYGIKEINFYGRKPQISDSSLATTIYSNIVLEEATETDTPQGFPEYPRAVSETSTVTEEAQGLPEYPVVVGETGTATEQVNSGYDVLSDIQEDSTGADTHSSTLIFLSDTEETLNAATTSSGTVVFEAGVPENSLVEDVAFTNADFVVSAEEVAAITDEAVANIIFVAAFVGAATGVDGFAARFLWELIDDSQSVTWQNIGSSTNSGWVLVDNSEPGEWTDIDSSGLN